MAQKEYQQRTIRIAKGEYKPKANEPKVYFPSLKSASQLLSQENQELLKVILDTHPNSILELAKTTGRAQSNLTRTLKKLSGIGVVTFEENKNKRRPIVQYTDFDLQFGLNQTAMA